MKKVLIVAVGDPEVGKTSLLEACSTDSSRGQLTSAFDSYNTMVYFEDAAYTLTLQDTQGTDECINIRSTTYEKADVILICYSVSNITSFNNVKKKWIPEIRSVCPKKPFLIVGLKVDLRQENMAAESSTSEDLFVMTVEARAVARKYVAASHTECSAHRKTNLKGVIEDALNAVVHPMVQPETHQCFCLIPKFNKCKN